MEHRLNVIDRGKPMYSGKTCPSATLSTINPTWTDPESNPGLRGERPATNRLSYGTAICLNLTLLGDRGRSICEPLNKIKGLTNGTVTKEEAVWAKKKTAFEEDNFLLSLKA
jgi:hypothetical protein